MAGLRLDGVAHRLLDPADLSIAPGGLVFVSGPSGAGKSLLLRAIADLDPHRGEVWLGDESRSSMPVPTWRRRVGLLPAESAWWAENVGDHLPPTAQGGETAGVSLLPWLQALGFDADVLSWTVGRLSTGERQRLALIRLLAQRPEALLLDEATANLDPGNRDRVETVLNHYRADAQAGILWVSHDPDQRTRLGGQSFVIRNRRLEPET